MSKNTGYMRADRQNDELYTPFYAVDPIIIYLPHRKRIWTPCDLAWSAFPRRLKECGYQVTSSALAAGQDFFEYEPPSWDIIVTNPPYSIKDQILARLYELDKPFAVLLPLASLQGKTRFEYFQKGIQILAFDARVAFHDPQHTKQPVKGTPFAVAYFCRGVLPKDLIVEHLKEYDRPLF